MTDAQLLLRIRAIVRVYTCVLGGLLKQGRHRALCVLLAVATVLLFCWFGVSWFASKNNKASTRKNVQVSMASDAMMTGSNFEIEPRPKQGLIFSKLGIGPEYARVGSEPTSGFGAFSHNCDRADPHAATLRAKRSRP